MLNVLNMEKPFTTNLLIFLIIFLSISALAGGWGLITDVSGANLGFTTQMLKNSPFSDFLIPSLFLLIFLGLLPLIVSYGLIKKPKLKMADKFSLYKKYHWSWNFSYYLGIVLIMWINIESLIVKEYTGLQFSYSVLGVIIIVLTNLNSTKKSYKT